ncbi:hypothetical protein GCM10022631_13450 [Deinococcus rubellus]
MLASDLQSLTITGEYRMATLLLSAHPFAEERNTDAQVAGGTGNVAIRSGKLHGVWLEVSTVGSAVRHDGPPIV